MMPAASGQSAIALRAPSDSDALRCRPAGSVLSR